MKSIDKLRDLADYINAKEIVEHMQLYPSAVFDCKWLDSWHSEFNRLVESLEAEIAERYMLLPVDADGVPIHVGDVVAAQDEQPFEVRAFQLDALGWFAIERLGSQWNVNQLHHVKPRTLENIVADAIQYGHNGITGDRIEGKVAEFCAEIRELLGGDAE